MTPTNWRWIALLVLVALALTSLGIYKLPVQLETLLAQELQADEVAEIQVREMLSNPYFAYDYTLTEPQEIKAVLEYLKDVTVRKRLYTPKTRTICSPELYHFTLTKKNGSQLFLTLDDNLGFAGKQCTVVKPKSRERLHELIAGSPAWWQE